MIVIPAIDLMNGRVVRLTRGDPNTAKTYDYLGTPVEMAQKWKAQGAERLHVIDLDASFGKPNNLQIVAEISKATSLPIQVGGGIRSVEAASKLLSAGIEYVILGALAFQDPPAIATLQKDFGADRVIVALDHRNGIIMVEGWKTDTTVNLSDALRTYISMGVDAFLITSITKDGTLSGPDLITLQEASQYTDVDIIAAGGIGSLNDLIALKKVGATGAVVGKALYEGKFTLNQALEAVGRA